MDEQPIVIEPESIRSIEELGVPDLQMRGYVPIEHLWGAEHFVRLAA